MNYSANPTIQIDNPFLRKYKEKINVILFAHNLIGTVRGKSANGLMMHSKIFNVVAIVDQNASGKNTSELCQGVGYDVPVYPDLLKALKNHKAKAVVFLIALSRQWYSDIEAAIHYGLDLINTSFEFINNSVRIKKLAEGCGVNIFDLRDVTHQQAYPNINILNRKAKVVYVTGTDCGLGKRTTAFELTQEAIKQGIKATMYATGQTGLMLGEFGTVVDSLVIEFSNGVVSQQVCQLCDQGYELIFVEGQSDIFHPANSAAALAILHGANPDCIILVHDESRIYHKGFEEDSALYKMHNLRRYVSTLELLSLPCGPVYKTIGIATIGRKNIFTIKKLNGFENMPVADIRLPGGPSELLKAIMNYTEIDKPVIKEV